MSTPLSAVIQIAVDSTKAKQGSDVVEKSMARVQNAAKQTRDDMGRFQKKMDETERTASSLGSVLQSVFAGISVGAAAAFVYSTLTQFQDAMIEVANTTGKSGAELRDLEDRMLGLSAKIPASTKAISELVNAGSQLGIEGNDNLTAFAETMERVGAVTDIKGAQGAKSIAQLLRASSEPVDVSNFERIGGAINALSDASGASGQELLGLGTTISQLTERFGMGSEEALAIAASLNRFGVESGSAAMVVGKLFGVMDQQFVDAFGGDSMAAFQGLLTALRKVKDEGGDVTAALDAMGVQLDGRTGRAVLALVNGTDELSNMLRVAKNDTANLNDLQDESERVFEATSKQVGQLWDSLKDLVSVVGRDLMPGFSDLLGGLNEFIASLYTSEEGVVALTDRGKIFLVVLGLLTAGVLALVAAPLVGWLVGATKAAIALAGGMSSALLPVLVVLGAAIAAILAFDLGGYFYDEFKIVQETSAAAISMVQQGWTYLKSAFKITVAAIREAWDSSMDFLLERVADLVGNTAWALNQVGLLSDETLREFEQKERAMRDTFGDFNFDDAFKKIKEDEKKELAEIEEIFKVTMENIDREFQGKDRKTGKSWFERFGEGSMANLQALKDLLGITSQEVQAQTAQMEEDLSLQPDLSGANDALKGLVDRLTQTKEKTKEVKDETEKYREELEDMLQALRFEAAMIGKTNDERERAEALVKVTALATKGYADNQDEANRKIEEYMRLLDELQKARGLQEMREMNEELEREIGLLGRSKVVRENASDITEYMASAMRAYGGDVDQANAATERFIATLEQKSALEDLQKLADDIGDAFGSAFESMIFDAKSFEDAVEDMVKNVARMVFQMMVTQQIAGFFSGVMGSFFGLPGGGGSFFGGGRAKGGPVEAGKTYVVGEEGPEVLRLGMSGGYVVPNHVAFNEAGSRRSEQDGPTVINMTVNATDAGSFRRSQRQITREITSRTRRFR